MAEINKDEKGYIKNRIFVHKGEQKVMLEQVVTFDSFKEEGSTTLFSFWDDFKVEGKEETESQSILNIEKTSDGNYRVRIKKPEIFASESEQGLSDLIANKDGSDLILNIDPNEEAISLQKNGTELIVKVNSTDGQTYTITAGATNISIEYGEKSFKYQTNNERAISTNVDSSIIEEFFDKDKKVCRTPRTITAFPSYLIGLFEASLEKNTSVTYGQFTITKIDLAEEGKEPSPCLFVTKEYSTGKKINTVYINGKLQRCDDFLCQYQKSEDGKLIPSIVLDVEEKSSKKTYYNIPLSVQDGNLSDASKTALELMGAIATNESKGSEAVSFGEDAHKFYLQDSREYSAGDFTKLKPARRIIQEKEDVFVEDSEADSMIISISPESDEAEKEKNDEEKEQPAPVSVESLMMRLSSEIKNLNERLSGLQASGASGEETDHISSSLAEFTEFLKSQASAQSGNAELLASMKELLEAQNNMFRAQEEARIKAEKEAKEKAEAEARAKEEAEAQARREEEEAQARAEEEARIKAEEDAKAEEQRKKQEAERKKKEEEEAKLQEKQAEEEAWAEKQAELKKKQEEDFEKDKEARKKTVDLSKPVETLSTMATFGGVFLFAASVLTPIGAILAPIGLIMGAGGIVGQNIAGELKFTYFKKAKYKLKEYEQKAIEEQVERDIAKMMEVEQKTYIETFIEQEQEVSKALENTQKPEQKLEELFDGPLSEFGEIYNDYGIGFSADLEYFDEIGESTTRTSLLSRFEGLEFRQQLVSDFQAISSAKKVDQRQALVSQFISTHFAPLPEEQREKVERFFSRENQPKVSQLVEAMQKANDSHAVVKEKQDAQAKVLSNLNDYAIEQIISSDKLSTEGRAQFFKSYSPALIKRLTKEDSLGEVRLIKFVTAVPLEERETATRELSIASGLIDKKIQYAKDLARKRDQFVAVVKDVQAKNFTKVSDKIVKLAPKISSLTDVEKAVEPYLLTYDRAYHASQVKPQDLQSFKTMLSYFYGGESNLASMENQTYEAWQKVYEYMKDNHFSEIAKCYQQQKGGLPYPSPYDTIKTPRKHKTIVEVARAIAKEQDKESELNHILNQYNKANSEIAYVDGLGGIIGKIGEKLSGVDVDEKEVKAIKKRLAGCEYTCKDEKARKGLNGQIAELTVKLNKRIKELGDKKDDITADEIKELDNLKSAKSFIDSIISGKMSESFKESCIITAIDERCKVLGIKDTKISTWSKLIKEKVNGTYVLSDDVLSEFSSPELRTAITKKLEEIRIDSDRYASSDLLDVVEHLSLGDLELTTSDFDAIFNAKEPLSKSTHKASNLVSDCDKRCLLEIASMGHDLEEGFGERIFHKQARVKTEAKRYGSLVELLSDLSNKDNDEVLEIAHKQKYDLDKILKKLEIKEKDYLSAFKTQTFSEFAPKDELKAFDLRLQAGKVSEVEEDLRRAIEKFKDSGENMALAYSPDAPASPVLTLHKFLTKGSCHSALEAVGIDNSKLFVNIDSIARDESLSTEEKKAKIDALLERKVIFRKLLKRASDLESEAQLAEKLARATSDEEKELLMAQFRIVEKDAKILEFKTKYEAILGLAKKGYDESTIAEALEAFANGDENYFFEHSEVELPEPYFFSEDDVELCKSLKISKRKIKAKMARRHKVKAKIDDRFKAEKKKKTEKVKQLKAKVESEKEKPDKKLTNKELKGYEKKIGVFSSILSLFHKEAKATTPEKSEYERVANAGYLYSGNEIEKLSAEEKQPEEKKAEDSEKSAE